MIFNIITKILDVSNVDGFAKKPTKTTNIHNFVNLVHSQALFSIIIVQKIIVLHMPKDVKNAIKKVAYYVELFIQNAIITGVEIV